MITTWLIQLTSLLQMRQVFKELEEKGYVMPSLLKQRTREITRASPAYVRVEEKHRGAKYGEEAYMVPANRNVVHPQTLDEIPNWAGKPEEDAPTPYTKAGDTMEPSTKYSFRISHGDAIDFDAIMEENLSRENPIVTMVIEADMSMDPPRHATKFVLIHDSLVLKCKICQDLPFNQVPDRKASTVYHTRVGIVYNTTKKFSRWVKRAEEVRGMQWPESKYHGANVVVKTKLLEPLT